MTAPTHFNFWLFAAPIALVLVLIVVVGLSRRSAGRAGGGGRGPASGRGPVSGGVIEGDPGQRKPGRHEAPRTDRPQDTREDEPGG